jgi:hypothetical protein
VKKIYIDASRYTLVDDEDYDELNKYKWSQAVDGYIVRTEYGQTVRMHNEVLKLRNGSGLDHIDRNRANNQKSNLRIVDHSTNCQNKVTKNNFGFKGVSFKYKKFRAVISRHGKQYHLGYFETPEEAARVYDRKALELYGPAALTNAKLGNFSGTGS